jgi:hypothetical protein
MIKLKNIINEIAPNNLQGIGWKTPTGTPDEVINVMHRILETIMRNLEPGRNPLEYINLAKLKDSRESWVIRNPINDYFIIYITQNKMWLAPDDVDGRVHVASISTNGLDLVIKNWMV